MWDLFNPFAWFVLPSLGFGAATLIGLGLVAAVLLLGGSTVLNFGMKVLNGIWDLVYPGLQNIAQNGSSIIVMLGCMYGAYLYADAQGLKTERALIKQRDYFALELKGYKTTLAKTRAEAAQCVAEMKRLGRTAKKLTQ